MNLDRVNLMLVTNFAHVAQVTNSNRIGGGTRRGKRENLKLKYNALLGDHQPSGNLLYAGSSSNKRKRQMGLENLTPQ